MRTVCVCPKFVNTKLSAGFQNDSTFLSPTLTPQTLTEEIWDVLGWCESGVVVLPRTHNWLTMTMRGWPWWMQVGMSQRLKEVMRKAEEVRG